jgi:hypothetical protein
VPTSDANSSRDDLVRLAIGILGEDNPSPTQILQGVTVLNLVVKNVDVEGKWLWTVNPSESTLTLSAATQTYAAGSGAGLIATNILSLVTFSLYLSSFHWDLDIFTQDKALKTTYRDGTGKPIGVYLERRPDPTQSKLWVYPTPDATYTAKYTYRRRLYDFDNATDNPDFPQEWVLALAKRLAAELAPFYGIPMQERLMLRDDATIALREMKQANAGDVPDDKPTQGIYF